MGDKMRVLVACEESQRVCIAFREKGHEAYSCDILPCSGGHPEWHIKKDVLPLLNGFCEFTTCDGARHRIDTKWDMIIAFPPCTHLAVSGARHFEKKRKDGRQRQAIELFCRFFSAECDKICIENPVNIISGHYIERWFPDLAHKYGLPRKADCTIQPYYFGNPSRKTTNLWLKGLPNLKPTNIVEPNLVRYNCANGKVVTFSKDYCQGLNDDRSKKRSKTFPGIAKAMADQWG